MKNLKIALQSEYIKGRNQKGWLLILIAAAILPLLYAVITMFEGVPSGPQTNLSTNLLLKIFDLTQGFALTFLSFGIAIVTAQIASVEHKNNTWQLIETQPLPKWAIYFAKYLKVIFATLLIIISFFVIANILFILLYYFLKLDSDVYYWQIIIKDTILYILNLWCSSMSLTATLFVLHVLFKKTNIITSAVLIGILGYTMSKAFGINVSTLVPIVQLDKAAGDLSQVGEWITFYSRLSIVQSIVILLIGYVLYYYKNYRANGLKQRAALVKLGIILLIGSTCLYWQHLPKYQNNYGKTILAGKVTADIQVDTIVLLNSENLPILTIPIQKDGTFHVNADDKTILIEPYFLVNKSDKMVFKNNEGDVGWMQWSNGDSIYAAINVQNNESQIAFSGDRRAEQESINNVNNNKLKELQYAITNNFLKVNSIDEFISKLRKAKNADMEKSLNYVSVDGYRVGKDVQKNTLSLISLEALATWQKFIQSFPKLQDSLKKEPAYIASLKMEIDTNNVNLFQNEIFKNYYYTFLNNGDNQIKDISRIALVSKIKNEKIKEVMYFDALKRILANNVLEDSLVFQIVELNKHNIKSENYLNAIQNDYYARMANASTEVLPPFFFKDAENNEQGLQQYLGKYVIIDVWATWCGPCKYNAPYFYEMAEKYKDQNIVFVSISVDKNIAAWKQDKSHSPHVINWITDFQNPFMSRFAIQGIPRFILIGPDGKPINSKMPYPSEKNFEQILKQAIS